MSKDLILLKVDDPSKRNDAANDYSPISTAKIRIEEICKTLCSDTGKYEAQVSVKQINSYITSSGMNRILYSEISHYVFTLSPEQRGVCITNADKLLEYVLNSNNIFTDECKKAVIKVCDHCNLAVAQTDRIGTILEQGVEETKSNFNEEIKNIQKDYITILGIFASVILAFIGGITFSTSVFENIHKASPYRIVFISALLGFTLLNAIRMLLKFLLAINNKELNKSKTRIPIMLLNSFFIIVLAITAILWLHFRHDFLPFLPV